MVQFSHPYMTTGKTIVLTRQTFVGKDCLCFLICCLLLLLLLNRFSRVQLCATPETAAHQAPLSLGFSRQEYWSGLPFPSLMHESESEREVAQSCPTLSSPMDCSPPGSSIHGIFQARVLEWGAIAFSDDQPRQRVTKQRHYFPDNCLSTQMYGFSSSHVWM